MAVFAVVLAFAALLGSLGVYLDLYNRLPSALWRRDGDLQGWKRDVESTVGDLAGEIDDFTEKIEHRHRMLRQEWESWFDKMRAVESRIDGKRAGPPGSEESEPEEEVAPWEMLEGEGEAPVQAAEAHEEPSQDELWRMRNAARGEG